MYSDKEAECPFEFKTWTPEGRNRKIEKLRRSVQVSLFSLERANSYQDPVTQKEQTQETREKADSFDLLVARKKPSSANDTDLNKRSLHKTNKTSLVKKRMLEAVQNETNFAFLPAMDVSNQKVSNEGYLNSLNNLENSKSLTEENDKQPHLNLRSVSKSNTEDEDSDRSPIGEDFQFSLPKTGEPRHSIFFSSPGNEVEELKQELQIEDGDDIHFIQGNFFAYYQEGEILGEGASGTVKKCNKIGTSQIFAVKIVRYRGDTERLYAEVKEFENHKRLCHRNIIKVYELYIDYFNKKTYLVMELVECREMLEVIQDRGCFNERLAAKILKQVISGISYLHLNGVCHRDLKPDNIMISEDGSIVKIVDFNVSKFTKSQDYTAVSNQNYKMWTQTGTIAFSAPEVFNDSEYTEAVDMWSVGVILYTMLCGYQPFQADNVPELIEKIKKAEYEFHDDAWERISHQAKDLVTCLLTIDVKKRYLPFQALTHPWIESQGNSSPLHSFEAMDIDNLWSYINGNTNNQQQIDEIQDDNISTCWNSPDPKPMTLNIKHQKSPSNKNTNNMTFSSMLLLSKLSSSFGHIEGKCLSSDPEEEEGKDEIQQIPKITHFKTQQELPYIFTPSKWK